MAQVIYTGENYRKYVPSQGKALAALGQLAQQTQYRKEMDTQAKTEGYRVTLLSFIVKVALGSYMTDR